MSKFENAATASTEPAKVAPGSGARSRSSSASSDNLQTQFWFYRDGLRRSPLPGSSTTDLKQAGNDAKKITRSKSASSSDFVKVVKICSLDAPVLKQPLIVNKVGKNIQGTDLKKPKQDVAREKPQLPKRPPRKNSPSSNREAAPTPPIPPPRSNSPAMRKGSVATMSKSDKEGVKHKLTQEETNEKPEKVLVKALERPSSLKTFESDVSRSIMKSAAALKKAFLNNNNSGQSGKPPPVLSPKPDLMPKPGEKSDLIKKDPCFSAQKDLCFTVESAEVSKPEQGQVEVVQVISESLESSVSAVPEEGEEGEEEEGEAEAEVEVEEQVESVVAEIKEKKSPPKPVRPTKLDVHDVTKLQEEKVGLKIKSMSLEISLLELHQYDAICYDCAKNGQQCAFV